MSLNINIPDTFNGPMDLLLHLIRRDEMDIYDIPIARLAASYLQEIERMELVDVDEGAEFLDLASRLLEIKSRMLIPPDELPDGDDEEDGEYDPRANLVESLLEYRRFKDAARMLGEMAEEQARRYPRVAPFMDLGLEEESSATADSMDLFSAFQGMLLRMMPQEESNVITYTEIPTSIRIEQISTVLREIGSTRFSLLLSGSPSRREMVGFFIAMLEMIRQGRVTARQTDNFSDIILERKDAPAPAASARARAPARPRTRCFPETGFRRSGRKRGRAAARVSAFPGAVRGRPAKVRRAHVPRFI